MGSIIFNLEWRDLKNFKGWDKREEIRGRLFNFLFFSALFRITNIYLDLREYIDSHRRSYLSIWLLYGFRVHENEFVSQPDIAFLKLQVWQTGSIWFWVHLYVIIILEVLIKITFFIVTEIIHKHYRKLERNKEKQTSHSHSLRDHHY